MQKMTLQLTFLLIRWLILLAGCEIKGSDIVYDYYTITVFTVTFQNIPGTCIYIKHVLVKK